MRNLKYIPIILLSFILCESNTFAQKKKGSKSSKRVATRMMNRTPVVSKSKSTETETTTETPVVAEPQPEQVDIATLDLKNQELENLQAQMQALNNKILEKQDEYRNIDSKIEDINEAYMNLEQKQNKSKNSCEAISVKKMDEIKGWLIATVASSGVGTAANATATVTSFLQKDESQIDKQNQKSLERATEKAKNQEIKNLEKQQKQLQKQGDELANQLYDYQDAINHFDSIAKSSENNTDKIEAEESKKNYEEMKNKNLEQINKKRTEYKNNKQQLENLQNNSYTGEANAKTTDYEKQAKTNKNLSTASKISSIVGTVASGAATITSTVATGLVTSISQQVKKCKETF
ncbi:hypothetical protein HDR59_04070 [bacterium]|nr:hypothetical protein [bacterium]